MPQWSPRPETGRGAMRYRAAFTLLLYLRQPDQNLPRLIPQKIILILHIFDVAREDTAVGVNPFGDLVETV